LLFLVLLSRCGVYFDFGAAQPPLRNQVPANPLARVGFCFVTKGFVLVKKGFCFGSEKEGVNK
jgi:hypothetical protein